MTDLLHKPRFTTGMIAVAVLGYFLPWMIGGSISLTLGAYDLAEWVSLRLPARPMDTVLLLRAIPVLIAILIGLHGSHYRRLSAAWWFSAGIIVLFAIALLPPFEFFIDLSQRGDVNYYQQFQLSGAAFLLGLFALSGMLRRLDTLLTLIACAGIIALTGLGLSRIWPLLLELGLTPQVGVGPVILLGAILALCITVLTRLFTRRTATTHHGKQKETSRN